MFKTWWMGEKRFYLLSRVHSSLSILEKQQNTERSELESREQLFVLSTLSVNPTILLLRNHECRASFRQKGTVPEVSRVTERTRTSEKAWKPRQNDAKAKWEKVISKWKRGKERRKHIQGHPRPPPPPSPRGCKAFQSTRLHNIHSSNQFYQRNQYGWNIGLLWLVTFSWGLREQGNVFTMIRLKQPGHWVGSSSEAAIIIIIITKMPFLWLTFGPYFQRIFVWLQLSCVKRRPALI